MCRPSRTRRMLATKLRALLQREKGRDLFDLAHGLDVFETLNKARLVECFNLYLERSNVRITRAEAEQRMLAKLRRPRFLDVLRPLLPATALKEFGDDATQRAFLSVFTEIVAIIPGEPWANTDEALKKHGIAI